MVQACKKGISLLTPRRTFARIQPTTKQRVDLGMRLEGLKPGGRLRSGKIHETMPLLIGLSRHDKVDAEVVGWLRQAYAQNC